MDNIITEPTPFTLAQETFVAKPETAKREKKLGDYIDGEEFFREIMAYQKQKRKDKTYRIPESIGKKLMLLSERYARRGNFVNYTYKDKMISESLHTCIKYIDNFDPKISTNPFAYFTRLIWSAFLKTIITEKKNSKIKKMIFDSIMEQNIADVQMEITSNQQDVENMHNLEKTTEQFEAEYGYQPVRYRNPKEKIDITFKSREEHDTFFAKRKEKREKLLEKEEK
jgi:hypothetical protein